MCGGTWTQLQMLLWCKTPLYASHKITWSCSSGLPHSTSHAQSTGCAPRVCVPFSVTLCHLYSALHTTNSSGCALQYTAYTVSVVLHTSPIMISSGSQQCPLAFNILLLFSSRNEFLLCSRISTSCVIFTDSDHWMQYLFLLNMSIPVQSHPFKEMFLTTRIGSQGCWLVKGISLSPQNVQSSPFKEMFLMTRIGSQGCWLVKKTSLFLFNMSYPV